MTGQYAMYALVALVAIAAFALNPSLTGIGYALLVIVGAGTVWFLRELYLDEVDRDNRGG
jgi:hypothetical protein